MLIRDYRDSDRTSCAAVYERAWNGLFPGTRRSISPEQLEFETNGERMLVAELNGEILGFASYWEPDSFLHHLHVDPDYQGQGIGTALLRRVGLLGTGKMSLKCQTANFGARRFYSHHGFVESDERGEDEFGAWVRLTRDE